MSEIPPEIIEQIEDAFDYRGDVTIHKKDGSSTEGYVFNRVLNVDDPYLDMLPKPKGDRVRIPYASVERVEKTGRDMASGRSWEEWVRKNEEKKRARAEGRDIGDIEPRPTHLEAD